MYAQGFEYYRAKSVAEAAELLRSKADAKLLAGGHSLLPAMKLRVAGPAALVDIGRIAELRGIKTAGGALSIGALTTHAEIAASAEVRNACPLLTETAGQVGDIQVRNRGTIGGSIAHADPAADLPAALLALEAKVTASDGRASREIAAADFFVDLFTTALRPGEIVTSISVPRQGAGLGAAYLKHRHPASSYAVVGVAALVEIAGGKCGSIALAVGGVTVKPVRATTAEQALTGRTADDAAFAAAAENVRDAIHDPLSDLYASGEYRTHLAVVMTKRALALAARRARG
ncbi:MAG TPA: xanthine dehydrogenase family protein subunit M [Vicinamibacteria bacterium]|nr:xanthine dehydrogenase family protein subunit M [Vicinamibacteria bacterium]